MMQPTEMPMDSRQFAVEYDAFALLSMADRVEQECKTDSVYVLLEEKTIREAAEILNRVVKRLDSIHTIQISG